MLADGGVVDENRKTVFTDANTDTQTGKPKSSEGFTPQGQGAPFVQQAKANAAAPDMAASNAKEFQSAIDTEAKMNAPAPIATSSQVQPSDFMGNTRIAIDNTIKGIPEAYKVGGFPGAVGQAIREAGPTAKALLDDVVAKPLITAAIPIANTINTAITGDAKPWIDASTPTGFKPQGTGQSVGNDASKEASAANPAQAPSQSVSKVTPPIGDKIYNKEARIAEYVGDHGERAFSNILPEDRNKGGNMTVVPANTYGMYDPTTPLPVAQPTQQAQGFDPGNQINHVESVGFGFEPKDPAIARSEEIQRNAEMAAGRAGIGQYTPKMLEAETNKMQAYDTMATAGMNNATRQDEIAANAAAKGAELAQHGSQFDATNQLAKNADNRAQATHGIALADSLRMEAALDAVTNAKTPEDQSAAAAALRAIQGKDKQEVYGALPPGNTVDAAGNVIRNEGLVYNKVTGSVVNTSNKEGKRTAPSALQIEALRQNKNNPSVVAFFEKDFGDSRPYLK
jgi:hypothetical protein